MEKWLFNCDFSFLPMPLVSSVKDQSKRERIIGELFQSELFWRVIFMQIRLLKVMNSGSLQSQLSSNT